MKHTVLGFGSYGCVVYPALFPPSFSHNGICDRAFVSKIFFDADDADIEYNEFLKVKAADKDNVFTLTSLGVSRLKGLPDNVVDFCHRNEKNFVIQGEYYQIIYERGGEHLQDLPRKRECLPCEDMLSKWLLLMKGLESLQKNEIVHGDIKPGNIMFNRSKLALIDFGHTSSVNRFRRNFITDQKSHHANHLYPYYPPEMILLSYMSRNIDFDQKRFENRMYWQYENFGVTIFVQQKDQSFNFLKALEKKACSNDMMDAYGEEEYDCDHDSDSDSHHRVKDKLKNVYDLLDMSYRGRTYAYAFDVFSLGISMLQFCNRCKRGGKVRDNAWLDQHVYPIIMKMCDPVVEHRCTITDAINDMTQLLGRDATRLEEEGAKIMNPYTGRLVSKKGKVGKGLVAGSSSALRSRSRSLEADHHDDEEVDAEDSV